MRKLSVLAALAALCGVMAAVANAGSPTLADNGNVLMLDAAFNPALSSTKRVKQGANLEVHVLYGNLRGNPTADRTSVVDVKLPKDTKINQPLFARCPVATAETQGDAKRCPPASKIGTGEVVVDARASNIPDRIVGKIDVYNGATRNGLPTITLIANLTLNGTPFSVELPLEVRKGPQLVQFDPENRPEGQSAYSIERIDLNIGKTVNGIIKGRKAKISYFETPSSCKKTWAFEIGVTNSQQAIRAKDTAPCVKVVG